MQEKLSIFGEEKPRKIIELGNKENILLKYKNYLSVLREHKNCGDVRERVNALDKVANSFWNVISNEEDEDQKKIIEDLGISREEIREMRMISLGRRDGKDIYNWRDLDKDEVARIEKVLPIDKLEEIDPGSDYFKGNLEGMRSKILEIVTLSQEMDNILNKKEITEREKDRKK